MDTYTSDGIGGNYDWKFGIAIAEKVEPEMEIQNQIRVMGCVYHV